jgi:putative SOS response-associated peptidase YedK
MCYSAQIIEGYKRFVRTWGATISLQDFARVYIDRIDSPRLKVPKALDAWFDAPASDDEQAIHDAIVAFNSQEEGRLEQELFKQRKRLADAQRSLTTKVTKSATESERIATEKIEWCRGKLADLQRSEPKPRDSRIYPGWYAPVMVVEDGLRVVKLMRYQCRPAGKPAFYDTKYTGTFNARRDNLEGFWKGQFGVSHGIMAVSRFYENVQRDGKNVILEFRPRDGQEMLVACLWSCWQGPAGEELLSFAAITDEPPAEVADAGHDRCIVPIKPAHMDAWLNPKPGDLAPLYSILDDRERPYYEHRLAA